MSSTRLPGKILKSMGGRPMLQYLLERLERGAGADLTVVATSEDSSDTPVAHFCREIGVPCYRGPLHNVAQRFLEVADAFGLDALVRLSGDSPLLDQSLVAKAIDIYLSGDFDLATNIVVRTFPKGQSVEVLRTDTFRAAVPEFQDARDLEHVTPYFYRNAGRFRIADFQHEANCGKESLVVDTPTDFNTVERVLATLRQPHWTYGWEELLQIKQQLSSAEITPA